MIVLNFVRPDEFLDGDGNQLSKLGVTFHLLSTSAKQKLRACGVASRIEMILELSDSPLFLYT